MATKKTKSSISGPTGLLGGLLLLGSLLLLLIWQKGGKHRKRMTTRCKDGYLLYDLLVVNQFSDQFAEFITSQAAHETDNFSSQVFVENFNPFGMTYQGQGTALGEKNGYAYYTNYQEAVADYKRLFKSYGIVSLSTIDSFVKLLQNRQYFTATIDEYLNGCTWFYNLYFSPGWEDKRNTAAKENESWSKQQSGAGGTF